MGAPTDLHNWLTDAEMLRMHGTLPVDRIEALIEEVEHLRKELGRTESARDQMYALSSCIGDALDAARTARDRVEDELDEHVDYCDLAAKDGDMREADADIARCARKQILGDLNTCVEEIEQLARFGASIADDYGRDE